MWLLFWFNKIIWNLDFKTFITKSVYDIEVRISTLSHDNTLCNRVNFPIHSISPQCISPPKENNKIFHGKYKVQTSNVSQWNKNQNEIEILNFVLKAKVTIGEEKKRIRYFFTPTSIFTYIALIASQELIIRLCGNFLSFNRNDFIYLKFNRNNVNANWLYFKL